MCCLWKKLNVILRSISRNPEGGSGEVISNRHYRASHWNSLPGSGINTLDADNLEIFFYRPAIVIQGIMVKDWGSSIYFACLKDIVK